MAVINKFYQYFKAHVESIYSKRGSETEFTYLATDTHSPYTDNRVKLDSGKPEERQYYAFYFSNDYEVGQASDIVTAVMP